MKRKPVIWQNAWPVLHAQAKRGPFHRLALNRWVLGAAVQVDVEDL